MNLFINPNYVLDAKSIFGCHKELSLFDSVAEVLFFQSELVEDCNFRRN
jgi:hypothetical protein